MRKWSRLYWISLVALTLFAAAKGVVQEESSNYLPWVALLFAIGLVLGAATFAVAKSRLSNPWRGVLVGVLGYHALFGPVMLAYLSLTEHSRNGDLPLRIYPHIITFIDSLE